MFKGFQTTFCFILLITLRVQSSLPWSRLLRVTLHMHYHIQGTQEDTEVRPHAPASRDPVCRTGYVCIHDSDQRNWLVQTMVGTHADSSAAYPAWGWQVTGSWDISSLYILILDLKPESKRSKEYSLPGDDCEVHIIYISECLCNTFRFSF